VVAPEVFVDFLKNVSQWRAPYPRERALTYRADEALAN
jgi:hypothetical protein